jgi:phosphonate transport system substrate-binding protein
MCTSIRALVLTFAAALLTLMPGPGLAYTPDILRVSAIPDENPTELMRIYTPFTEYLAKQLGLRVQFVPVVDYAATVEGLAARKLDLVWYGGFTSVQAVKRTNGQATRLAMRKEDAEFKSVFVSRKDGAIKALADLKGKTFAFGSVSSTSGHLMPRYFLLKNGINPDRDFAQKPAFSGAHDATALWVESGKVDAGALNFLVWDKLIETKKIDTSKVGVSGPHRRTWTTCGRRTASWIRVSASGSRRRSSGSGTRTRRTGSSSISTGRRATSRPLTRTGRGSKRRRSRRGSSSRGGGRARRGGRPDGHGEADGHPRRPAGGGGPVSAAHVRAGRRREDLRRS